MNNSTLTPDIKIKEEHVITMIEAMKDFEGKFIIAFNRRAMEPLPSSIATKELDSFAGKDEQEHLESAYSMGIQSIDYAAEHLLAFMRCATRPCLTLAPITCARALMESCAIASFFLDPTIGAMTRLERSFSFRREGFAQQIKLLNATGNTTEVQYLKTRDDNFNQLSQNLGFRHYREKNGVNDRFGLKWPGITSLVKSQIGQEVEYRIFSAVAHGHHWANHQIGYEVIAHPTIAGRKVATKQLHPKAFLFVGQTMLHALSTATHYLWELYAWDESELHQALNNFHSSVFEILGSEAP